MKRIPSIVPRKRVVILIFTLLFSSAIFTASTSIFSGVENLYTDLYGNQGDVVVIYDSSASTPYTSSIPASLEQRVREFDGVLATSGELIIPIVAKGEASFLRGATWEDFSQIVDIKSLKGSTYRADDQGTAVIGKDLADRFDLDINDILRVASTVKNGEILLKIVGIVDTGEIHNDEIITSIPTARKLSIKQNDFTHILAKIDKSITSAEEVLAQVEFLYEIKIRPLIKNGTEIAEYWKLEIFNSELEKIHSQYHWNTVTLNLPLEEFTFQAQWGSHLSPKIKYNVTKSDVLEINIQELIFGVDVYVHNNGTALSNKFYEVIDVSRKTVLSGYLDENGTDSFYVKIGAYSFRIWDQDIFTDYSMTVLQPRSYNFDHSPKTSEDIKILGLKDNMTIPDTSGYFTTNYRGEVNATIDGIPIDVTQERIEYNLSTGPHNITVATPLNSQKNYNFVIDPNIDLLIANDFSNYSHHELGTGLSFTANGLLEIVNQEISSGNITLDYELSSDYLNVKLPEDHAGVFNLTIRAISVGHVIHITNLVVTTIQDPKIAGIPTASSNISFQVNEDIPIWYSEPIISVKLDDTPLTINSNAITIPSIASGDYTLEFTGQTEISTLVVSVLDDYGGSAIINNQTETGTIGEGLTWYSDQFSINYDQDLFKVEVISNSYQIPIFRNIEIPSMIDNEVITDIRITSKLSGMSEIYPLDLQPNLSNDFIPLVTKTQTDYLLDPIVSTSSLVNDNLNWKFTYLNDTGGKSVEPLDLEGENLQLPLGFWEISVTGSTNSKELTWITQVPQWSTKPSIDPNTIIKTDYFSVVSAIGQDFYLPDLMSIYSDAGNLLGYNRGTASSIFIGNNVTSSNEVILKLHPTISEAVVNIQFSNGTQVELNYHGYTTIEIVNGSGYHHFTINGVNYFGEEISAERQYLTQPIKSKGTLTVINNINEDLPSTLTFQVKNIDSGDVSIYETQDLVFPIEILPGNIKITTQISGDKYSWDYYVPLFQQNFAFNLSLGLLDLKIRSFNTNFNTLENFTGKVIIENIDSYTSFSTVFDGIKPIQLFPGTYRLTILTDRNNGTKLVTLNSDKLVTIPTIPVTASGVIRITGSQIVDEEGSYIQHEVTGDTQDLIRNGEDWYVNDFPIGNVSLFLQQGNSMTQLVGWFQPELGQLVLSFEDEPLAAGNLFGKTGVIQTRSASDFSIDTISGPLSYTRILLIAEIIIISIALLINISGVFSGFASESRVEIRIARNLGFTELQLLLAVLWDARYLITIFSILGGFLGLGLTQLIFEANATILFGHRFTPVFPWYLWIVDLLIMNLLALLGAKIGIWLEESAISHIDNL